MLIYALAAIGAVAIAIWVRKQWAAHPGYPHWFRQIR